MGCVEACTQLIDPVDILVGSLFLTVEDMMRDISGPQPPLQKLTESLLLGDSGIY
jgi:hypothetical protein